MGESTGKFWRELRRRRVVSTAAAYAAGAFILLQLGEILFPAFGLGPDSLQALFWLLLTAFPVVLALAWVFDVTRQGLKRTAPLDGDGAADSTGPRPRPPVPPSVAFVAGLAISVLVGAFGWRSMQEESVPSGGFAAGEVSSSSAIAVLPFADRSPGQDQAYLGDGLAEEVLNSLAGVEGLQVAARTSSFAFRNTTETALDIGQQLNVGWLLEGSVQRDSGRLRVSASLSETLTGRTVWTDIFESDSGDFFAVQDSIATAIVGALLGRLDLPESTAKRHVASPEAQEAYYRARAQWNQRDASAIPTALRLFQDAVQLDSMYAAAYAGLADSHALLPQFVLSVSADDSWARAEEFALRALELDPNLAEAHASLGLVKAMRRDRIAAVQSLDRALELNPSYAPALHWRANVLADMGRLDDALRDMGEASLLDALSPAIAADHGNFLMWSGDVESAELEFDAALSLEFGFEAALFGSALIALQRGQQVPFLMQFTQWGAIAGVPTSLSSQIATAAVVFQRSGQFGPAPSGLQAAASGGLNSGALAQLSALVGDREGVIRWLRKAVEDGSWVTQYLAVNSLYAPYREDPEFLEILVSIGG